MIRALPADGLAGSKLTCASNFLNTPATGTFICFDTAVIELFARSTSARAVLGTAKMTAANTGATH